MENDNVNRVDLDQQMRDAYLDYAMSVIVSRALPDARDGLKPVHRRILYAMQDMGVRSTTAHKKSARIVGEVLGKYHPHGDASIYDAMVRMAQDFSMRYPLVDGHGNFGSIDGDPPAAMRYTEARMAKITDELLADIDKETIDFMPNFDGSEKEPVVLPSKVPNLLLNGSNGIAVGMATNIPSHNLREINSALAYMIDNYDHIEDITVEDLMQFVKGPDFPTGGIIIGREGIKQAYTTGKGRIIVRARSHVEEGKAWVDGTHQVRLSLAGIVGGVIQSGGHSKVSLEIKNEGDTHMSDLLFRLKNPDTQLQYTSPFVGFAELPAGTTTTIDWDANVQLPAADNYILDLIDVESYVTLASLKNVSVEGTPTAPVLALENTPIAGSEDMKFHRNDLCLTINVMNYGTTYQGDIVLRSDDYMSGLNVEVGRQQVNLPPGKSTFDFHCDASDSGMKIGKVYECRLYEGDKPMQPYDLSKFSIPLSDDVNIGISETFMNPNVVSFYDIQGRRLQGKGSRGIRIACLSDGTTIKIED